MGLTQASAAHFWAVKWAVHAQGRLHLFVHTPHQFLLAKHVHACISHQPLYPMNLPLTRKWIVAVKHQASSIMPVGSS